MASTSPTETQLVQPGSTMESRNHRKLSLRHPEAPTGTKLSDDHEGLCHHDHEHDGLKSRHQHQHQQSNYGMDNSDDHSISIPAASRHAEQTVAPFLAKHIPMQYNPLGQTRERQEQEDQSHQSTSTRFCYRHRPDLKCRRQANEPSMEQLQNELGTLSQSDQQAISHVWSLFSAAPSKHRNLMLQGILTQCCFPQLSFISASVRDLIKIDFLSALPSELGFKILCYLDTTSLCKAAQVSQRWRSLADDDVVWHRMCEQHIDRKCTKCGWGLPLLERKRLRTEKRQIQLRATGRGINEWSPAITPLIEQPPQSQEEARDSMFADDVPAGLKRPLEDASYDASAKRLCSNNSRSTPEEYFKPRVRPWKDVYKDRFKVGTNWKYGRCSLKTFKGHTNGVMCLQFDENILMTGSYDSTVKVWDIESGKEIRTIRGHTSGIRCLQFDDTKLMTGSMDHTVRLWNWRTGECTRTFNAHNGGVISLHFEGRWIASGSMDHTIRVWDSETKQTFCLRGHTDWVNAVRLDAASRTLFSASDDCTVRLWDLDTRQCIKVFEGHVGQVQQVLPLPPEFELDDADLALANPGDKDDDGSSTASSPLLTHHHPHIHSHSVKAEPDLAAAFWNNDKDKKEERPAPPRYMLTGALDSTIRLWDVHAAPTTTCSSSPSSGPPTPAVSTHCLRTFFGHVEGIWALAADHLRLVSGSEDRMVKIWDPRTGRCERTWTGHAGPVTCVGLSDSRLVSGSEDCEVRMLVFSSQEGGKCESQ